jgi:hypothetical protein
MVGSVQKPLQTREPSCVHPGGRYYPMSSCGVCKSSSELADWKARWAAWLAENPNSLEARFIRATKRCIAAQQEDADHLKGGIFYPCHVCSREELL